MIQPRPKLPRKARLAGGAHFTGAFSASRHGRYFIVLSRTNPDGGAARLGVVVSRRTAPRAVSRSLMKRLVREEFRRLRGNLGSVDVVIRVRQAAGRQNLPEARRELERLLDGSR